jgi:hypothetical protein
MGRRSGDEAARLVRSVTDAHRLPHDHLSFPFGFYGFLMSKKALHALQSE